MGNLTLWWGTAATPKSSMCLASNGNVGVLLGNGDGTFQPRRRTSTPWADIGAASVAVADLRERNARLAGSDRLCNRQFGGRACWVMVTEPSRQWSLTHTGGLTALSVAVADVNGDNKPDVVVANWCTDNTCVASSVGVLLGNGDGTFQTAAKTFDSGGIYGQFGRDRRREWRWQARRGCGERQQ